MSLHCKWANSTCLKTFYSAEELFNHLCDFHVGRKRHGNLSLSCSWDGCDHKAAKRDHMTSHMMVHCPLQTNVCGICQKTFKRSYDLRKHEVTHTLEHHKAHGRSRAVIYTDLQIPLISEFRLSTPINSSRVYSSPKGQSNEGTGATASIAHSFRRGSSISNGRGTPYERPQREKKMSFSDQSDAELFGLPQSTYGKNEFSFPEGRSIPLDQFTTQFKFYDDYSTSSDSPLSDLATSNFAPSVGSVSTSPHSDPTSNYANPSNLICFDGYSYQSNELRRSSQPNFFSTQHSPSVPTRFINGFAMEESRAGSLPGNTLYPTNSEAFLHQTKKFDFNHMLTESTYKDNTILMGFPSINPIPQDQSNFQYVQVEEDVQYPQDQVDAQYPPDQVLAQLPQDEVYVQYPPDELNAQYPPDQVKDQYPQDEVNPQYTAQDEFKFQCSTDERNTLENETGNTELSSEIFNQNNEVSNFETFNFETNLNQFDSSPGFGFDSILHEVSQLANEGDMNYSNYLTGINFEEFERINQDFFGSHTLPLAYQPITSS